MKKAVLGLTMILICLLQVSTVYAGTLNEYENEVMAEAQKVYEWNGVKYKADQVYIDQLREYLSTDGLDLTAEQRDEVLQAAYGSVEKGVKEGYLSPVEETSNLEDSTTEDSSSEDSTSEDNSSEEMKDKDLVSEDTPASTPMAEESIVTNVDDSTNTKDENNSNDIDSNFSSQSNLSGSTSNIEKGTPEELISQILSSEDDAASNIIKNTGFDFSNLVILVVGMGILMVIGIIVATRQNLFVPEKE